MLRECPVCSKINPADAQYCYYDGRALSKELQQGPLNLGTLPFPSSLYFSDGQACANFNQVALACDTHWEEARALLSDGIWTTFFGGMGRLDLAAAAKAAAAAPDPDRGLSQLLEKLPADPDFLRPAKLAVQSAEEKLEKLTPGTDKTFEIVIANQGMLVLHGMVSTTCDWLVFGGRAGPKQRAFETRSLCPIQVRALGAKLRAGLHPMQAEVVIDSNGGTITVPIRAEVPIRPFPKGISAKDALAGAMSPREIALKAKDHPKEAATLFEMGAVKAWYEGNGWTYPIEGSEGSGKGAVQQFFEALGLVKPPRVEINTKSLTFGGKVGTRLSTIVIVSTEENKPVYAHASSNQNWVTFGPAKYLGNKVKIPVEITVPPFPEQIVHAQVMIRGNGNQHFAIPVTVTVESVPTVVPIEEDTDARHEVSPPGIWQQCVDWFDRLWK